MMMRNEFVASSIKLHLSTGWCVVHSVGAQASQHWLSDVMRLSAVPICNGSRQAFGWWHTASGVRHVSNLHLIRDETVCCADLQWL